MTQCVMLFQNLPFFFDVYLWWWWLFSMIIKQFEKKRWFSFKGSIDITSQPSSAGPWPLSTISTPQTINTSSSQRSFIHHPSDSCCIREYISVYIHSLLPPPFFLIIFIQGFSKIYIEREVVFQFLTHSYFKKICFSFLFPFLLTSTNYSIDQSIHWSILFFCMVFLLRSYYIGL